MECVEAGGDSRLMTLGVVLDPAVYCVCVHVFTQQPLGPQLLTTAAMWVDNFAHAHPYITLNFYALSHKYIFIPLLLHTVYSPCTCMYVCTTELLGTGFECSKPIPCAPCNVDSNLFADGSKTPLLTGDHLTIILF